jgi:AraC-like DNA-binding protein
MVSLRPYQPSPALKRHVKMHLFAEVENPELDNSLVTPRGCHALITVYKKKNTDDFVHIDFNPGVDTPHRQDQGICLIGHYTKSFRAYSKGTFNILYTVFEPAGAIAFFGSGQHQFTDACIQTTDFNRNIASDKVFDELSIADGDLARIKIIENMLLDLAAKRNNRHWLGKFEQVADWIISKKGNVSINEIADQCGMSKRTLERKFLDIHGVSPKQYTRIVRFRSVVQYLQTQTEMPDWHELLYRSNYYDQSHFIHDFREFTGQSPLAFLQMDRRLDSAFVQALK